MMTMMLMTTTMIPILTTIRIFFFFSFSLESEDQGKYLVPSVFGQNQIMCVLAQCLVL